jgi:hypothetical protein
LPCMPAFQLTRKLNGEEVGTLVPEKDKEEHA